MKKLVIVILGILSIQIFGADFRSRGQGAVQTSLITWTTGASTGKTRIRFMAGAVYLDTSTTGQAGEWKRIDNTADSCSQPFLLTSDSTGSTQPVWMSGRLRVTVKSADPDSSTRVYRIQTRERHLSAAAGVWTDWSRKGANSGYSDVTVQDSILLTNLTGWAPNTKTNQYSMGSVFGVQARVCPDNVVGTAGQANDSIIDDSLTHYTR